MFSIEGGTTIRVGGNNVANYTASFFARCVSRLLKQLGWRQQLSMKLETTDGRADSRSNTNVTFYWYCHYYVLFERSSRQIPWHQSGRQAFERNKLCTPRSAISGVMYLRTLIRQESYHTSFILFHCIHCIALPILHVEEVSRVCGLAMSVRQADEGVWAIQKWKHKKRYEKQQNWNKVRSVGVKGFVEDRGQQVSIATWEFKENYGVWENWGRTPVTRTDKTGN